MICYSNLDVNSFLAALIFDKFKLRNEDNRIANINLFKEPFDVYNAKINHF